MKTSPYPSLIPLFFGIFSFTPFTIQAAETFEAQVKTFTMTISGSSTLHDWESQVEKLNVKGALMITDEQQLINQSFTVAIPVEEIKSPHKKMDKLTYEALKSKDYPEITYTLIELKTLENNHLRALGTLTIAGKSLPFEIEVTLSNEAGELFITGNAPITMTDYMIKPPSLMFGTINVGAVVNIHFELTLTNKLQTKNTNEN